MSSARPIQPVVQPDNPTQVSLLHGVAEAARCLLSAMDFDAAANAALAAIAQAATVDRIYIVENSLEAQSKAWIGICPYEWTAPGILKISQIPGRFPMAYSPFGDWPAALQAGQPVQGLARDLSEPAQALQRQDHALSLLVVPIHIADEWWGVIGLDDCTSERIWNESEIAVLETAAVLIGSALERDRTRLAQQTAARDRRSLNEQIAQSRAAELETYNQQLRQRDSLLNCVNAATRCLVAHNELVEALPAVLQILGEGTAQSRAYILKNVKDEQTGELMFTLEMEWNGPGILSKLETGGHFPVPINAFPDHLTEPLKAGRATQFLARELGGKAALRPGQALSLMGVPITVAGEWWGLLGLDDCEFERVWSEAEITVLETAAACVSGAIERDRTFRARAVAERTTLINERTRLAREIHDTLAQSFTGISLQLEAAKGVLSHNPQEAQIYISRAGNLARRGLSEARRSVRALRSEALETATLHKALETAVREMTQESSMRGEFYLVGTPLPLPENLQTNLLRIGQEAITNALRHAQAKTLTLTLHFTPAQVRIQITDDGIGTQISSVADVEGFGLVGMRERAARFEGDFYFNSVPGEGTTLEVVIPIRSR
ncbi:MAG: GAF domain-containing protein [Phormidesmis sp.]